jgi:mannose-6-phosphate isomerase-like protein (cupin superfamily)
MASAAPDTAPTTGRRVVHVPAGEGRTLWVADNTYTIKADTETTNGALAFFEATVPPGGGPPPHVHAREDEAYYLISGELEVLDGDRTFAIGPGDFVFIPRGTLHRFRNPGLHAARMIFFFTPAGFENFFIGVGHTARPGQNPPPVSEADVRRSAELAAHHGLSVVRD